MRNFLSELRDVFSSNSMARNPILSQMDPRDMAQGLSATQPMPPAVSNALVGMIPGIGDAIGLGQDVANYAADPGSRNWKNGLLTLAALLPGIPARVYHGTGKQFADFSMDAPKTTLGGFTKHGVSVSEDPAVASRYAMDFYPEGGSVRSLSVTSQKPLSLSAQEFEKLQTLVSKLDGGQPLTELEDVGLEMLLNKHGIAYGGHPIDAIKAAGFDAIQKDAGRYGMAESEALIFDPSKLKTEWGR
jgi:hypothetical protein